MDSNAPLPLPDLPDVLAARRALAGRVLRTPVLRAEALDELAGARLAFKAECLQLTGSFKVRGATNRIRSFSPAELAPGLITVSAGNAALGAAWAAREARVPMTVVMPERAVPEKLAAVAALGARIEKEGVTDAAAAFERLAKLRREHGYTLVHPFDDPYVIAGAATATWELLEEEPGLDALLVPTSGGGLLAGALLAVKGLAPKLPVYGVQPEGAASLVRSLEAGRPVAPERMATVADGLTAPKPGEINFELIHRQVAGVLTVPDEKILEAMGHLIRNLKVIVEPAGAAAFAALLALRSLPADPRFRGQRLGLILSGGNAAAERVRQVV